MTTTQTTTGLKAGKEATMATTTTRTFQASIMAANAADALARVEKHLSKVPGFATTGRVAERSQKHLLWSVEIADQGGDVNRCWVILTSYGISPDASLGSRWENVKGVGC
jgi:hypothetical protein